MISANTVERTWQQMSLTQVEDAPRFSEELERKQPFLLAHLHATGEALFEREIAELYFYISIVVYQIMKKGKRRVRQVSEEIMQAVEEKLENTIELLDDDTDADFVSSIEHMTATHLEPEVLRYIVEAIMEEDGDIDVPEEDHGLLFLELQKVLDALILSRDWYLKEKNVV